MFFQLVSLLGAFLILVAYLAINRRWMNPHHRIYNLMNLVGGLLLLWVAIEDRRIGFMVLEAAWAIIAVPPLVRPAAVAADGAPAKASAEAPAAAANPPTP